MRHASLTATNNASDRIRSMRRRYDARCRHVIIKLQVERLIRKHSPVISTWRRWYSNSDFLIRASYSNNFTHYARKLQCAVTRFVLTWLPVRLLPAHIDLLRQSGLLVYWVQNCYPPDHSRRVFVVARACQMYEQSRTPDQVVPLLQHYSITSAKPPTSCMQLPGGVAQILRQRRHAVY